LFLEGELAAAMEELPLTIISNESALEYERQHLPAEAWPPTSWFQSWATGRDVFPIADGRPPMELRWILCQRR
ncbi:MAG: class I SAM-dependent methyltransferase, partial [Okeania sp. SIO2H7]|nr:class I SAM-dependent methyltransferase [Okeania sp. SIO2H7]